MTFCEKFGMVSCKKDVIIQMHEYLKDHNSFSYTQTTTDFFSYY